MVAGFWRRPELPVLFMTGYAENAASRSEFLAPGMEMISKPFAMDALAAKIREMLRDDADDAVAAVVAQPTPENKA